MPHSRDSELAFTQKKIEANFSNFSAWHQRGKVLGGGPFVGGEEEMKRGQSRVDREHVWRFAADVTPRFLTVEFDLVSQALWTDPSDQSAWLYHRFLISKSEHASLSVCPPPDSRS